MCITYDQPVLSFHLFVIGYWSGSFPTLVNFFVQLLVSERVNFSNFSILCLSFLYKMSKTYLPRPIYSPLVTLQNASGYFVF